MVNKDIPIDRIEQDKFNVVPKVKSICDYIYDSESPITIALQGEWGSGKTSFMNLMDYFLCRHVDNTKERFEPIWLNTWALSVEKSEDDVVRQIVLELLHKMNDNFSEVKQKIRAYSDNIKEYSYSILNTSLKLTKLDNEFTEMVLDKAFKNSAQTDITAKKKKLNEKLKEEFESRKEKGFVIFVDDLDRLEPVLAVSILEALKNLFDLNYCVFVLAIDYDIVSNGVKKKYGDIVVNGRDISRDFFDKLIQIPYTLPMSKYDVSDFLNEQLHSLNLFQEEDYYDIFGKLIYDIVVYSTNKNPRAIKRLINLLRLASADGDGNSLPEAGVMMLLLMAIQLAFPVVYTMIEGDISDGDRTLNGISEKSTDTITDSIRKRYYLDSTWKEQIYLAVCDDRIMHEQLYRIFNLLRIYDILQGMCMRENIDIEKMFGVVNITLFDKPANRAVLFNGESYSASSQTQYRQGNHLINQIEFAVYKNALDIGCGSGETTIEMWSHNYAMHVDAFDLSESQIGRARKYYEKYLNEKNRTDARIRDNVSFSCMDALSLNAKDKYDLIFSNATLHWIPDQEKMYRLIYDALMEGGNIAIHQGGEGTYRGLHEVAWEAVCNLNMQSKFEGWKFPACYPKKEELEDILREIGFVNIRIEQIESDEKDNMNLVDNFANASLIFYKGADKTQIRDSEFATLKKEYLRICKKREKEKTLDKYSNRLYVHAMKPRKEHE